MNKKAKKLSDWYAKLAKNDNGVQHRFVTFENTEATWVDCEISKYPKLNSNLDLYLINLPKPIERWMWVNENKETLYGVFNHKEEALKVVNDASSLTLIKLKEVTDKD